MNKSCYIFCSLFFFTISLFSQSISEWQEEIKENFDDVKLVINSSKTTITFKTNKEGKPFAEVSEDYEFESLQSNDFSESHLIFFDDNKTVNNIYKDGKKSNFYKSSYYDYSGEGIFHSDVKLISIPLDFSKLGEQHSLSYKVIVDDIRYLTQYFFNKSFACKSSTLKIIIPQNFDVELKNFNIPPSITIDVANQNSNSIHTYTAKLLEPWHNESNVDGPTYIYPHILLLPKSVTTGGIKEVIFEKVSDLYRWYKKLVDDMDNDPDVLQEKVTQLIADKESELDKVKAIFYWVQENVRYIAFEDGIAGFKPETCQNVYENKYGDCKGMANLTAEMLTLAGFDARLTWLGTRRISYSNDLQSLAVNNHMICTVMLNGQPLYLDPTIKFSEMGLYPIGLQDQEVLIEDGENYIRKVIPVIDPANNTEDINISLSINEGDMVGLSKFKAVGESKMSFLAANNYVEKDELGKGLQRMLSRRIKTNIVDNVEIVNVRDKDKPIEIDYNIRIQNAISAFGDELYIEIDPFKDYDRAEIKKERKFDYTVQSRRVETTKINLQIPEDLTVSYLPEELTIEEEEFRFSINYIKTSNEIIYTKRVEFFSFRISKENFEVWNEAIKSLKNHHREQIILNKK